MNDLKIRRLLDLQEDIEELEGKLTRSRQEVTTLKQEVGQVVQAAADRFLVDEQGQPVNGALYWYNRRAIVRLGGLVEIVPVQTMDEKKIFAPVVEIEPEED